MAGQVKHEANTNLKISAISCLADVAGSRLRVVSIPFPHHGLLAKLEPLRGIHTLVPHYYGVLIRALHVEVETYPYRGFITVLWYPCEETRPMLTRPSANHVTLHSLQADTFTRPPCPSL